MTEQAAVPQAPPEKPAKLRTVLDVILEVAGHPELPDEYDTWGWKVVRPDFRSYGGYLWPWPGGAVADPEAVPSNDPCPVRQTGGFCVALSAEGAASGGHGHETVLLLAYRQTDILAADNHKLRVRSAYVADVVDGRAVWRASAGADLTGANLSGANLTGANLAGAYLAGADLTRADLAGADLAGVNLAGAYLAGADLAGASLTHGQLTDAQAGQFTGTPAWIKEKTGG